MLSPLVGSTHTSHAKAIHVQSTELLYMYSANIYICIYKETFAMLKLQRFHRFRYRFRE